MTMMTPALAIVPIFATPFAVVSIADHADLNAALASLIARRATAQHRDPSPAADPLCFRGREDFFEWDAEAVVHLRQEMLGGVSEVVLAANQFTDAESDALGVQARARVVIVRPNGALPAATAPMASWQAVYCVAAPPLAPDRTDSAVLRLYAIRHSSMYLDASNYRMRAPFSAAHYVWPPVPGHMAVFPASTVHEVALNRAPADLVLVTARLRFAAQDAQATMPSW